MKLTYGALILALWIQSFPGYTQTDSLYCLPIQTARLLVEDAMRLPLSEALLATSQKRVELLESEKTALHKSFTNLLKIEQLKYETQKQITANMESWGNSWRDQATFYQKKDRKHRREKKLLIGGIAILIGVMVVK